MARVYTTYDAKSRFSEIMRKVRNGQRVIVTYRGRPVAEIGPVSEGADLDARIDRLTEEGVIEPAAGARLPLAPLEERPGALERFLESRE